MTIIVRQVAKDMLTAITKTLFKSADNNVTIINSGCSINGAIQIKGHLIIEGTLEGTIQGDSVLIEKDSRVTATIQVSSLSVAGIFKGEIDVTGKLTLLSTADVEATIRCRQLVVEAGARLNGKVTFSRAETTVP